MPRKKPWGNLVLRVYPCVDGSFVLYEDELDNFDYEKGAYTDVPMSSNDSLHRLTLGTRKDEYKDMLQSREFMVVLPDGRQKSVSYSGKKVSVKF